MEGFVCTRCCAPLPPPDARGSSCRYCGTFHARPAAAVSDDDDDFDDDDDDFDEYDVVPMTDEGVLGYLRENLACEDDISLHPRVPEKKERSARRVHAAHLPPHERVLALYDDTVFGAGDDGFLVTSRRLCWRNFTESALMLEWHSVDPDKIDHREQRLLLGGGHQIESANEGVLSSCEDVFQALAYSARKAAKAMQAAPAGHPQQAQGSHGYGQQQPPMSHGYGQQQPPASHGYGQQQPPASHGYGPPSQAGWGWGPQQGMGGYGPPHAPPQQPPQQAAPVAGCWHCRTPLAWQSPHCPRCGARPGPQGWPRIA